MILAVVVELVVHSLVAPRKFLIVICTHMYTESLTLTHLMIDIMLVLFVLGYTYSQKKRGKLRLLFCLLESSASGDGVCIFFVLFSGSFIVQSSQRRMQMECL